MPQRRAGWAWTNSRDSDLGTQLSTQPGRQLQLWGASVGPECFLLLFANISGEVAILGFSLQLPHSVLRLPVLLLAGVLLPDWTRVGLKRYISVNATSKAI